MTGLTEEKKKKVLFLPKKTKDKVVESKSQCLEGIGRLVCRASTSRTGCGSSSKNSLVVGGQAGSAELENHGRTFVPPKRCGTIYLPGEHPAPPQHSGPRPPACFIGALVPGDPAVRVVSRLCRRFNTRARHLWPFSRRSRQSSAQENGQEPTDGVLNSMPLQEAQVPYPSSRMKHGRREEKPSTLSRKRTGKVPAAAASSRNVGLASTSTVLKTQVPQKLFATWVVDYSNPTCVPRWCSLTLKKLVIFKKLAKDLKSVVISLKMQDCKGILRSQEIVLPPRGPVQTDLALTFSLQYSHFLKGEANELQVMLEQRKLYKNRAVLEYKTLAKGTIHMAEVMQQNPKCGQMLSLYSSVKESSTKVAEIWISSLCSQPIEPEHGVRQASPKAKSAGNYTEGQDESSFSDREASCSRKHRQDLHKVDFEKEKPKKQRRSIRGNVKRKVLALFHRSKVSERGRRCDMMGNPRKSDPYMEDDESVLSVPRPKLRPYLKGLSDSSSQTEMWGSHSDRTQTEPLSMAHMPEKAWALGAKQPSDTENAFVAYSTPTSKVDKIRMTCLSGPPIDHEDRARQSSPKAESSDTYYECKCEDFFSQLEASSNDAHRQDQEEDDFNEGNLVDRRNTMTGQQTYHEKVLLWLHTVQVSEEDLDPEQDPGEHVLEVEEDLDLLYDMLENPSDSGPDIGMMTASSAPPHLSSGHTSKACLACQT
ncbi:hypothetical protein QTO34_009443 [Cnephaeus nilssonii]|uniref:Uncharacterized protein n=1 Tax=Cnephaeus nilssonii TaxID=3371016 RepID=A0AA40LFE0_CNENI|nr:hypothetical protein QTO34_009443 [Eptesicus nilssonii]